jgi:hypothetical protein
LAILSLAAHSSCSKSDNGSPGPVVDASTPIPDVSGPGIDATDATAADVSIDESLDTELDAVDPPSDSADAGIHDSATEPTDDVGDAASDAFDGSSGDAPFDTPRGTADATADADVDPCGVPAALANSLRGSESIPSGQIECTATKPCPPMHECIGGGCDDIWHCIQHVEGQGEHPCSTEPAQYCGCDNVTFTAVLVCPNRPYQRAGACEDGVSCDPTMLRCSTPEPRCPEGQVPSVVDGRYGACVPIHFCRCQFVWECPHREKYMCDTTNLRCTMLPVDP